jgi:hypothetical protein
VKRESCLVEQIADPENLRLAFWKAQRGKSLKAEAVAFRGSLDTNLEALRNEILQGEVRPGSYSYFTITAPKERIICAAPFRDRVLHHAIMNVCELSFERYQIFDSYACRTGKGTYAALARAREFQNRYGWFLKLDVRKYFYSISHPILKQSLYRRFKEPKLLSIFDAIIDSYASAQQRGVPIGNLTSQYFANHYLAAADHYVKEHLRIPAYVRYMDDMVLWTNDKKELISAGKNFEQFVNEKLQLQLKPFCLNKTGRSLPFLGYLLYPHQIRLSKNSRTRFSSKLGVYMQKVARDEWSQAKFQQHAMPLLAFTNHANTKKWRSVFLKNKS